MGRDESNVRYWPLAAASSDLILLSSRGNRRKCFSLEFLNPVALDGRALNMGPSSSCL